MIGRKLIYKTLIFLIPLFILFGCEINKNSDKTETYKIINNRDYFFNVDTLLRGANSSILIIMYEITKSSDSLSNIEQLKKNLTDKAKEGIAVKVILEYSNYNTSLNQYNSDAKILLENGGVDVKFDNDMIITHSKLIIVDDNAIVIGSANWSNSALDNNNETSIIIDDFNINSTYTNYFNSLWNSLGGNND
jgi:phosphatidylserine/phosphatidylglycerophosphate/cardiolipin synthase-like enzyme